jgi:hypothetical protein
MNTDDTTTNLTANRNFEVLTMITVSQTKPLTGCFSKQQINSATSYVDRVFDTAPDRHDEVRRNPFTDGSWAPGDDPIEPQKEIAVRAVLARQWFATHGPRDLQPLPLGYDERESLKHGGADHIESWYARSLDGREYDINEHPSFDDYACGVMASQHTPEFIKDDPALQRRFPPRRLNGLTSGLLWLPPKEYAKAMATLASRKARRR